MDARSIIALVRDGRPVDAADLEWFANGLASGGVTDAQAGAFAMAVLLKGLGEKGRVALTIAMRDSGKVMAWQVPGPVIDKHSTGGIGDCTSLLLAPALAACGAFVPMISGRGLGHTGGTLDKLEAIPGYKTDIPVDALHQIVAGVGCAIVSATKDVAPADRRLYGIRDVTSTVESVDLITASILSKKLAAGLEALVLDVKVGSGAFMKTMAEAEALATALVQASNGADCKTAALITDMNQPLATSAGNALEVIEVLDTLTGAAVNQSLWDLTLALGGEALALGGLAEDAHSGADQIDEALTSGRAAETFGRMVAALGGPVDFVERYPDRLPSAPVILDVAADAPGYIASIDGEALGHAIVHMGGGRLRGDDKVNPSVGLSEIMPIGEPVSKGEVIARIHAASDADAKRAASVVRKAIGLADSAPVDPPLIYRRIG